MGIQSPNRPHAHRPTVHQRPPATVHPLGPKLNPDPHPTRMGACRSRPIFASIPLPTPPHHPQAEWEGAARCGENSLYAGSKDINAVGWVSDNSGGTPSPSVAGKDANASGLYDMSGNVWEWTQDRYADNYTADGRTDLEGPSPVPVDKGPP